MKRRILVHLTFSEDVLLNLLSSLAGGSSIYGSLKLLNLINFCTNPTCYVVNSTISAVIGVVLNRKSYIVGQDLALQNKLRSIEIQEIKPEGINALLINMKSKRVLLIIALSGLTIGGAYVIKRKILNRKSKEKN